MRNKNNPPIPMINKTRKEKSTQNPTQKIRNNQHKPQSIAAYQSRDKQDKESHRTQIEPKNFKINSKKRKTKNEKQAIKIKRIEENERCIHSTSSSNNECG